MFSRFVSCIAILYAKHEVFLFHVSTLEIFYHFPPQDRKQTFKHVEEVLNTKVAARELVGDIQVQILHLDTPFLSFDTQDFLKTKCARKLTPCIS